MRKRRCLLFFVLFLAGCIPAGRDFPTYPIEKLQPNVTTKDQVYADFGEPMERSSNSGYETWTYYYYYYVYSALGLQDRKQLRVIFNRDGTVRNYSFSPS